MSVKTRYENGQTVPALSVKVRHHIALPAGYEHVGDDITSAAFESVQRDWWEIELPHLAEKCLKAAFKGDRPDAQAAGRSAGWVVVYGIGEPDNWNARQDKAWDRFEKAVKKSMKDAEKLYIAEVKDRASGTRFDETGSTR